MHAANLNTGNGNGMDRRTEIWTAKVILDMEGALNQNVPIILLFPTYQTYDMYSKTAEFDGS